MLRTAVNIGGYLSVSTAVANWENEFDKDIFERPIRF
jgi:Na+/H+-dicarboxylate symporter